MKKVWILCLAGILMLAAACGTAATGGGEPAGGGTAPAAEQVLRFGLDVEPETLDPRHSRDVSALRVHELCADGLIQLNEKLEAKPSLAESWENPDELTWIFYLRQGVKFHDGSDLTAEDVKYTYDTIRDPDFGAVYAANYSSIQEVIALDEYTVQFTLSEPYSPILSNNMELSIVPAEADSIPDFANKPIGTGPFKMVEWVKNEKITLEANPDYWEGAPALQRVEFYTIPSNDTRVSALESGDVDFVHTPLTPQDVSRIKGDSRFQVDEMTGLGITFAAFNHASPVLADKQTRVGLSHFLDKEIMASELSQGLELPGQSVLVPNTWFYSDVPGFPFDPEKGKSLLAEAGWTDTDGDGLLDRDGQKLTVRISTYTQDDLKMQYVEYMQNLFSQGGIDAQVVTNEWPTFIADVQSGDYDIAVFGMLNLFDPDKYMYNYLRSTAGSNWGGFSSKEFDALVEEARTVSDEAQRRDLYARAAAINNEEVMHNVLVYQGYVAMYSSKIQGYVPHARGSIRSFKNVSISE
ncbi:MAG: ABC transporter substrate-binding protein [Gracilibacteraceae bacterium]|jgi:peptide/nickel transport system substrate-binding protein|nr:ABC transporter substrate-binding protein [Gracilibacteraceae bacterium]